ncbi:MAG TPA: toxin-antitoxin system YwqK family antitoxin [Chryseolinea sp.]
MNRKFDSDKGIICGLTNGIATFENSCDNYKTDPGVTTVRPSVESVAEHKLVESLPENVRTQLRKQQDVVLALVGGLSASIVGAMLWAMTTVATNYQIGYMAIAVGLLVGFSVRYFGAGVDKHFGYIGAILALLGCALGNLLSQVIFAADAESVGYLDVLITLNFDLILLIFQESFAPIDLLFYGIAAYEGYRFAFRKITEDIYDAASNGKLLPLPLGQFRIPIAAVLYIMFAVVGFTIRSASNGEKIIYYPSGKKQSAGFLVDGKQSGHWQFWWENGKPMSNGLLTNGRPDSTWEYYSEEGKLYRRASFKSGVEHGVWTDYYENGQVNSSGRFLNGRKDGEWKLFYENGTLSQKGNYKLDLAHGLWEAFYTDGRPSLTSNYEDNEPRSLWTGWNEGGVKLYEIDYGANGKAAIVNSWSPRGNPEVKDGNGTYKAYHANGKIAETGSVKNRLKVGSWKAFYDDGNKKEVGHYVDDVYFVDAAWSPDGTTLVEKGEGLFEGYGQDGALAETGTISGGLREGEWTAYYPQSEKVVMSTTQYANGQPEGVQKFFFQDGTLQLEGAIEKGKREGAWKWYHQNAMLESSVEFKAGKKEGVQHFYLDDGTLNRTEVYNQGALMENKAAFE